MSALRTPPVLDVDALIDDPRTKIIVCCGSGGVGKTTTAAALGLRAAERGRDVVVLTVDPAKRLAQSMGLSELDNNPRRIDGVEGDGELHAMMLDMKRTFDEIVEAHSDPDRAKQILANPFYQSLSSSLSGTQEYMAMEKLGQLHRSGAWDLIVVDTPPSRNALDFLDAPERMGRFLEGRLMKLLAAPAKTGGRLGVKVLTAGFGVFTNALNKVIGVQLLRDVQTFVAAFETMFGASGSGPRRPTACCRPPAPRSWWWPRPSRTRCARPPTSWNAWPRSGCRWPASSSTGSTGSPPAPPPPPAARPPPRPWRNAASTR